MVRNGNPRQKRRPVAGAGGPLAATEHVRTNHKVSVCIQAFAGANEAIPPAGLAIVLLVQTCSVRVACQGMADKNRIAGISIECSVGFVCHSNRAEPLAAGEKQLVRGSKQLPKLGLDNANGLRIVGRLHSDVPCFGQDLGVVGHSSDHGRYDIGG